MSPRRILPTALLALALFLIGSPADSARAQTCATIQWGQSTTDAFTFTYQASLPLGEEIAVQFGDALDAEFIRFSRLFETTLPTPIMVRLYPNEREYYCFNALADEIPIGQTHGHIGGREIALIAQNISDDREGWNRSGLEALRYELAVLFVNQLSAEKAPPGLLAGIGIYAEDPFIQFEPRLQSAPPPLDSPSATWRNLWETPDLVFHRDHALQAASITAYLVDVYGWDNFLRFLNNLRTAESWRLALEATYPTDPNALESQWDNTYYRLYFEGRWRENALYGLSLEPYRRLIESGAYQAAADGLAEVIDLLVDLEDFERLSEAQALNSRAQLGLEADALARQARQAYLEADFSAAFGFAETAIASYDLLGDGRNLESLRTIRDQAAEIEALHGEMDALTATGLDQVGHGPRLVEIQARLVALGDPGGAARAAGLVENINAERLLLAAATAAAGAVLAVALLFMRIRKMRNTPPPEARLHP